MLALISLIVVIALILRRQSVVLGKRALWCIYALLATATPGLISAMIDVVSPQWPMRLILVPFNAVAEFAAPWIIFAIFNDKTKAPEQTEGQVASGSDAA